MSLIETLRNQAQSPAKLGKYTERELLIIKGYYDREGYPEAACAIGDEINRRK